MRLGFKQLGPIKDAEIELADITVLTGNNNQGKTYVSYSVYGFFNNWNNCIYDVIYTENDFENNSNSDVITLSLKVLFDRINTTKVWKSVSEQYSEMVSSLFGTDNSFEGVVVNIDDSIILSYDELYHIKYNDVGKLYDSDICLLEKIPESDIIKIVRTDKMQYPKWFVIKAINIVLFRLLYGKNLWDPFIVTSERTGISLFYKELDISKNMLIEEIASKSQFNPFDFIAKTKSRYAIPIHHNINYIRDIDTLKSTSSALIKDPKCETTIIEFWNKIVGGRYKVEGNNILFKTNGVRGFIPLYISSSSVKSLFSLDLFITHFADKGDILIIDEPELNLHPKNQVLMARLFARLANSGIRVFITTHSDYLVYELNNLVMAYYLSDKTEMLRSIGYESCELLDPSKLRVYDVDKGHIKEAMIDKWGIDAKKFASVTNDLSERAALLSSYIDLK